MGYGQPCIGHRADLSACLWEESMRGRQACVSNAKFSGSG